MPEPMNCAIAQGPSVPWPLWVLQTHLCTGMWRVHLLIHSSEQPWADGHAEPCSVTGPSAGFAICNLSAQSFLASLKSHLEDRPWGPHSPHGPHGSHRAHMESIQPTWTIRITQTTQTTQATQATWTTQSIWTTQPTWTTWITWTT